MKCTQTQKEKAMIKDKQLKMRYCKAEKELYSAEAKKRGLTVSDFIRYCITKEINSKKEGKN